MHAGDVEDYVSDISAVKGTRGGKFVEDTFEVHSTEVVEKVVRKVVEKVSHDSDAEDPDFVCSDDEGSVGSAGSNGSTGTVVAQETIEDVHVPIQVDDPDDADESDAEDMTEID